MAPTEGRVARPEQQWGCHRGTPGTLLESFIRQLSCCLYLQSPERSSEGIYADSSIEPVGLGGSGQQMIGDRSLCLGDVAYLVIFTGAGVQWPAEIQFSQNTAQRPHVDWLTVWQPQKHLRCPINTHTLIMSSQCQSIDEGQKWFNLQLFSS